jgi:hypothetical protein
VQHKTTKLPIATSIRSVSKQGGSNSSKMKLSSDKKTTIEANLNGSSMGGDSSVKKQELNSLQTTNTKAQLQPKVHKETPLTNKQKLAHFHAMLQKGNYFESQVIQHDRPVAFDTQYVAEHATHIYEHCLATQHVSYVNPDYMEHQGDINA